LRALVAIAIFVAAPAFAEPVTVDEAMKDVEVKYLMNDAGAALELIEQARPLAKGKDDEATLAAWQSLIFYSSHRYDDAKLAMRAACELQLEVALPLKGPQGYSHDFELVRRSVRQKVTAHPETKGQSEAAVALKQATKPVKPAKRAGAIVGIGGAAFAIAGAILVVHARRDYQRLTDATVEFPLAYSDAKDIANAGAVKQGLGITFLSVGGAAFATALILLAVGNEDAPVAPTVSLAPDGAGVGLVGRF
jgi:multisubunit Na+/H+ antiporter MnhB subunit